MAIALIVGTVIFCLLGAGLAYFVTDKVTKDVEDPKTKQEYRK